MEDKKCSIEQCDIFDFMANFVGMTVIHPGGFKATHRLLESCHIDEHSKVQGSSCLGWSSGPRCTFWILTLFLVSPCR